MLKATQVAEKLGVSRSTVYEWAHNEEAIRLGAVVWMSERIVRYDLDKLLEWIRKRSLRLRGLKRLPGRPRKGAVAW